MNGLFSVTKWLRLTDKIRFVVAASCLFFTPQLSAFEIDGITEFNPTDCWVDLESKAATDCGWLTVPERWESSKARTITLPVVVYRALNPDPSLAAVIYLSGGPGEPALGVNGQDMYNWRWTADNRFPGRTLIIFDQRGMGLGSPKLDCQEAKDETLWWPMTDTPDDFEPSFAAVHAAYAVCAKRHIAAGHDLTAFNSLQIANDVDALRRTLKLGDIILFGISYGTRLALTTMRFYPDNIQAVILDSVLPPQAGSADGRIFGPVLDRLFAACSENKRCALAYPDLRERFFLVLDQLADDPVMVKIWSQHADEPLYVRVDHEIFIYVLFDEMYRTGRIPTLPTLISGVAQGEYWRLKPHVENAIYGTFPDKYDVIASMAVSCNDGFTAPYEQPNLQAGSYSYLNFFATNAREFWHCADWFPQNADTINREPVSSGIPTLLLAGAFDPITTVEHAEMAARTLGTSHIFVFPSNGHVQFWSNDCSTAIVNEFLATPKLRPNPACLGNMRQPAFQSIGGN